MGLYGLPVSVLQEYMRSPLCGLQTCGFASSTTCQRTEKALVRMPLCASSPEPLLVAYMISTLSYVLAQKDGFITVVTVMCTGGGWVLRRCR